MATGLSGGTTACPRCGNPTAAGRKFCAKCGAALPAAAASPVAAAQPRVPQPVVAQPPAAQSLAFPLSAPAKGLSLLWLIIPTAIFVVLQFVLASQKNIPAIVVVIAAAGGLYWWKQQPLPPTASPMIQRIHPFAYALQPGIVFVMLGGVAAGVALAAVVMAVLYVAKNPERVVTSLEPWWQTQEKIAPNTRKLLAFAVPGVTGWIIGTNATGFEWGATLISLSLGALIAFLFFFTPPARMRPGRG